MTEVEVDTLINALKTDMPGASVDAEVVRAGRYRFVVVWESFDGQPHPDRQRRVWTVADRVLAGAPLLDVAMIITMAPSEVPQSLA